MTKIKKILMAALITVFVAALGIGAINLSGGFSVSADTNENIARGKTVRSSSGNRDYALVDGVRNGDFWEAEPYPATFEVDLEGYYDITGIRLFPYSDGVRYYNYEVDYSADGANYFAFASKTDSTPETAEGTAYDAPDGMVTARYVRVKMTYNSSNTACHMHEIEVYGKENASFVPDVPETDPLDGENVAYGKKVTSNLPFMDANKLTDGSLTSYWQGKFAPVHLDVDLGENYDVTDVVLLFPEGSGYYNYTVYGSTDSEGWERIIKKHDDTMPREGGDVITVGKRYRYIRVYLEYEYMRNSVTITEIRVHGTATGENGGAQRTGTIEEILNVKDYKDTQFAEPITDSETIENVYGIVERTVGKLYRSWFEFELTEKRNGYDYYELSDTQSGKILIKGNNGISLASGVNFYFKKYAKVNITEQANQTLMPRKIIPVGKTVSRETPYKVRYAFNYCTMDYSFAFFTEEDFQKEYDWLALNGVNLALDLAGQEAVWIKFLMNFGYSFDAAKAWLCGPAYYAWQFMDNMEIYGGSVTDGYVKERLESARRMQRWRQSLGMQTCLQAYNGMVPNDFANYVPDIQILEQGAWNGLDRPDMIRTDSELYDEYSRLFYEAQEWAFGATSDYYATDPFHEGGIRPKDLSDDVIAEEVLNSLLEYDENAVWVIQAWHSNPSNGLLNGMGDRKNEHALILDLCGLEAPKWNRTHYGEDGEGGMVLDDIEFNYTPWVWCMLENYGGNPSMDGELSAMIARFTEARESAQCLVGLGVISEAMLDNPVIYNMLFDMAWSTFELEDWIAEYVEGRYGAKSENALKAWEILIDTVYDKKSWYRTTPWMVTQVPEWASLQTLPYDINDLIDALSLLLLDFNTLSLSEGYRYDVTELMRQIANDYSVLAYNEVNRAFAGKKTAEFKAAKAKFLQSFDLMNSVLLCRSEWLAGEWIGKAEDWGNALNNDFAYDSLVNSSKIIITTWADMIAMRCIPDYAQRNYEGMLMDLYKPRWEVWLDKLEAYLENGTPYKRLGIDDYYHVYMQWVMEEHDYTRTPNESLSYLWETAVNVIGKCYQGDSITINYGEPDTELLNEFKDRYSALDRTLYTAEQLTELEGIFIKVAAAQSDPDIMVYLDILPEIEKAYKIMASPEAEVQEPEEPVKPEEPDAPDTPENPENPTAPVTPGTSNGGCNGGCASTAEAGYGTAMTVGTALAMIIAFAFTVTVKRRRNN